MWEDGKSNGCNQIRYLSFLGPFSVLFINDRKKPFDDGSILFPGQFSFFSCADPQVFIPRKKIQFFEHHAM